MVQPILDLTRISFPSDRLTIKAMRAAEPKLFAANDVTNYFESWENSNVSAVMWEERALAQQAFAKSLGLPDPHPGFDESPTETAKRLAKVYVEYGLASGPKHAKELIRGIETQANAQAKEHSGKGR